MGYFKVKELKHCPLSLLQIGSEMQIFDQIQFQFFFLPSGRSKFASLFVMLGAIEDPCLVPVIH